MHVQAPQGQLLEAEWDRTMFEHSGDQSTRTLEAVQVHREMFTRLAAALEFGQIPAGTSLEVVAQAAKSAGRHRYRGTVRDGIWHIESSFPRLAAPTLQAALELFRQGEEEYTVQAQTPEIAKAAAEAANHAVSFLTWSFWADGCQVSVPSDNQDEREWLSEVVKSIFLRTPEFQYAWELEDALAEQEEDFQNSQGLTAALSQIQSTLNQSALKQSGVNLGDLVLEGRFGRFFSAELDDLSHVEPEDVVGADEWMAELGFLPLGTLSSDKLAGAIARGYICPAGDAYGVVMAGPNGHFITEFYSWLENGSSLTSSTLPDLVDQPGKKCYRRSFPSLPLPELAQKHREAMVKMGKPRPTGGLKDLAEAMDDFMVRFTAK